MVRAEPFKTDIAFFINYSHEEMVKRFKKHKDIYEELQNHEDDDGDELGRMYSLKRGFVVRLKFYKNNYRENISIACHEIFHVINWILDARRTPLNKDTEEIYAYLIDNILYKFLTKLY